ncbi:MAG TPA: aminopeptidase P family protein [Pyrinomonadaceae bacterium]|nr:aminopeptidase P family protein [Pyrinomonadaceae bacterium]
MSKFNKTRSLIAACLLAAFAGGVGSVALPGAAATTRAPQTPQGGVIRVAPPAPVFKDEERRAELAARRERLAKEVGPGGVAVLFSAEPRLYTYDVDYEFRQENNLFYLTHLNQQNATLVVLPGSTGPREILFLPRRNPARETWDGYMYSPEDAFRLSGVGEIWDSREFDAFVKALQARQPYSPPAESVLMSRSGQRGDLFKSLYDAAAKKQAALHLLVPQAEAEKGEFGEHAEWRREQRFARQWSKEANGFAVMSAMPAFTAMRLKKSDSELRLLQHAIDITVEALGRAMAVAPQAKTEYEVEAEVDYTFRRRNADHWGYPSIVGCGPNATTLHYNASQGAVTPGELMLMDVGAEYMHYTADITRTFPVNGRFTKEQADIYNIVLAAQEAVLRATKPGASLATIHAASSEVIKDGLLKLGLITDRDGTVNVGGQQVPQFRLFFMHGTGHWLGMNVHDVGGRAEFVPGAVFTNEPGIYVRADALEYLAKTPENEKFLAAVRPAFERYKNIGVRIEDDILVTETGYRNLSSALPRTVPDIEAFMAKARTEVRVGSHRPDGRRRWHLHIGSPLDFAAHGHDHGEE